MLQLSDRFKVGLNENLCIRKRKFLQKYCSLDYIISALCRHQADIELSSLDVWTQNCTDLYCCMLVKLSFYYYLSATSIWWNKALYRATSNSVVRWWKQPLLFPLENLYPQNKILAILHLMLILVALISFANGQIKRDRQQSQCLRMWLKYD